MTNTATVQPQDIDQHQLKINLSYSAFISDIVELPEGRTIHDIADYGVKWDELYITWKDGTTDTLKLYLDFTDAIDSKRPCDCEAYTVDQDGFDMDELQIADEVAA